MLKYTAMTVEERLHSLAIVLPSPPSPGGNYLSARRANGLIFLAGVIPIGPDGVVEGTVGKDRTIDDGYLAARMCALMQLAVLRRELGTLDMVKEVVSLNGYVNAVPGFGQTPAVINGASDLLTEIFGEAGRHARAAVGVCALPRNALVEVQMVVSVREP